MEKVEPSNNYIDFMHWFQHAYSLLYIEYANNIEIPVVAENICVRKDSLNETAVHSLANLIWEFYTKHYL